MRTHEGKTRYMSPIYQPQHAVVEGKLSGFTYGVLSRFIPFADLPGKHRVGKPFRYHGFSDLLREFFHKIHMDDLRARDHLGREERRHREKQASYETITMSPVTETIGRHRLRAENQWPTHPQTLMAEAHQ